MVRAPGRDRDQTDEGECDEGCRSDVGTRVWRNVVERGDVEDPVGLGVGGRSG
jgi:hypothetical protein